MGEAQVHGALVQAVEAEVGDQPAHLVHLFGADFVQGVVAQRVEAGAAGHVAALVAGFLALAVGGTAGQQGDGAGGPGAVHRPSRFFEVAAGAGKQQFAFAQLLVGRLQAADAVVEAVVVGGGKQIEATLDQFVEHPGRGAEMRAAAFQRRIADEVVGQHLQVGEADIRRSDQVEQRAQGLVGTAVQAALQDAVAGQGNFHGFVSRGRELRGL